VLITWQFGGLSRMCYWSCCGHCKASCLGLCAFKPQLFATIPDSCITRLKFQMDPKRRDRSRSSACGTRLCHSWAFDRNPSERKATQPLSLM